MTSGIPRRRSSARRLAVEAAVVFGTLVAVVGGIVAYHELRGGIGSPYPAAAPNVDVSHAFEVQSEVSAVDNPRNPQDLVAGSNDERYDTRLYESLDGGRTWTSRPGFPVRSKEGCGRGDPALASDLSGRIYYALLVQSVCDESALRLVVAMRDPGQEGWRASEVLRGGGGADDKPAIAVDLATGRVYVAWTRIRDDAEHVLLSPSDDLGRTWSRPVEVGEPSDSTSIAALASAPYGDVYVALADFSDGSIWVSRSRDGGRTFESRRVATYAVGDAVTCGETLSGVSIPAQPQRCINPDPRLATAPDGRVYLTWNDEDADGTEAVWFTAFSRSLRVVVPARRLAHRRKSDQFFASLVSDILNDPVACFYDTAGDPRRVHTWFTCTASNTGGRTWNPPIRAADVPSDETTEADPNEYGDYEALVLAAGDAHPFWTDSRDLARYEEIFTATIPLARLGLPRAA